MNTTRTGPVSLRRPRRCLPLGILVEIPVVVVIPARVVNHPHPAREAEKGWQSFCQPFSLEIV